MVEVSVRGAEAVAFAAVRTNVTLATIGAEMMPALDAVWSFVRAHELTTGHNVALYHSTFDGTLSAAFGAMDAEFGVQVSGPFEGDDRVVCAELPAGTVATALHLGAYSTLPDTHAAIRAWCRERDLELDGRNWEVYGDWRDDPSKLETAVSYLLL